MLSRSLNSIRSKKMEIGPKHFSTSAPIKNEIRISNVKTAKKMESARMQEFHEKLKTDLSRVGQSMRFIDLVLVETDPDSGELIPNNEKEPTKWGDWQQGGRVTDF